MTGGAVLVIAGVWVLCQVFAGNALGRLSITGAGTKAGDIAGAGRTLGEIAGNAAQQAAPQVAPLDGMPQVGRSA